MVTIKGHEFRQITITNSYDRRAMQYRNKIISTLKSIGLTEDDMDIPLETRAMKKEQASVAWYMWDDHLFFSYNKCSKFVENLAMVSVVIDYFINLVNERQLTPEEFIKMFAEDEDIIKKRKEAREVLGVEEKSNDFSVIHKNFKKLSKELHPDMPAGDTERFKKINVAHKILKRELCDIKESDVTSG